MYALYCPQHVGDKEVGRRLDFGNDISCYMYDRKSVGEKATNTSMSSFHIRRTVRSPRLKTCNINRPCDRVAASLAPYEWNRYSHIPNVFQIRVEKLRKVYGPEDFDNGKDGKVNRSGKVRGKWSVLTDTVFPDFVFFERDNRALREMTEEKRHEALA